MQPAARIICPAWEDKFHTSTPRALCRRLRRLGRGLEKCFFQRRSVKKMCRWHIFSGGRSGYAARREPGVAGKNRFNFFVSADTNSARLFPLFESRRPAGGGLGIIRVRRRSPRSSRCSRGPRWGWGPPPGGHSSRPRRPLPPPRPARSSGASGGAGRPGPRPRRRW